MRVLTVPKDRRPRWLTLAWLVLALVLAGCAGLHLGGRLDHQVGRPVQRVGLSATARPPEEVARLYPAWRWRIFEAAFMAYAMFYIVRNNLSPVSKEKVRCSV